MITRKSGYSFDGSWHEGSQNGPGIETLDDGTVLEGSFESGVLQGQGKAKWPDGKEYEGEWRDGAPNKEGKMVYADGSWYQGGFISEKRHGFGKYYNSAGQEVYVGEWADDRMHGLGMVVEEDEKYEGEFFRGKREGRGTIFFEDGSRFEG